MVSVLREAELAGVLEDDPAVAFHVLIVLDAGRRLGQQLFQPRLAGVQRLRPEVLAIEFQQVEGVEDHAIIMPPAVQIVEDRDAVFVATDRLAVDAVVATSATRTACREQPNIRKSGACMAQGSLNVRFN